MLDTDEYFILYLDFLGSRNRIVDDEIVSLNQIHDLYSNTISVIRYLNSVSHNNGYPIPQYYTKIFSDNIIIAMKKMEGELVIANSLAYLIGFASEIQIRALAKYNWLVRGSITYGTLYISNNYEDRKSVDMIWGKALVRAYQLETENAIYPRVIIDKDEIENVVLLSTVPRQHSFKVGDDGVYYINYYLNRMMYGSRDEFSDITELEDNLYLLLENESNYKNRQKILWTLSYLRDENQYYRENPDKFER